MTNCIAIIGALKDEIDGIRREIDLKAKMTLSSFLYYQGSYQGREIILALSGMGEQKAREAAKVLLDHFNPAYFISIGISGAVDSRLRVGDLIIGRMVRAQNSPQIAASSDERLVELASGACRKLQLTPYTGDLITVSQVISTSEKKKEIFLNTGALAVEMETAFIGFEAAQKKCPFLAVRSISDTADYTFKVDVSQITDNGEINPTKFIKYTLRHPMSLLVLGKMKRNMRKATSRLNLVVRELVPMI